MIGDLFLLSERQMARIAGYFSLSHGVPRVDDRRVVSGIVYVIRNGLHWKDAPRWRGEEMHVVLSYRLPASSAVGIIRNSIELAAVRKMSPLMRQARVPVGER